MTDLDAIVVPSGRPVSHLAVAAGLSADLGSRLLCVRRKTTAAARNEGLDAAAALKWRSLLFLDDDVTVSTDQIRDALTLLEDHPLVAFSMPSFPDHSVLRHADPETPPVRSSGAALLVNMAYPHGRFPEIYNEDWLFMYEWWRRGGVADAGEVSQLPYDPFVQARARREEFGDLIAEALYGHGDGSWPDRIAEREATYGRVLAASSPHVRDVLLAGLDELTRITPEAVMAFLWSWRAA